MNTDLILNADHATVMYAFTRELVMRELREIHQKLRYVEKAVFGESSRLFLHTKNYYSYCPGGDIGAPPKKRMKIE